MTAAVRAGQVHASMEDMGKETSPQQSSSLCNASKAQPPEHEACMGAVELLCAATETTLPHCQVCGARVCSHRSSAQLLEKTFVMCG